MNIVIPAGRAILNTFDRNLPLILSKFGSSERINDGTPIVNMLIKVICEGFSGYFSTLITENTARSSEKIFFVK